MNCTSLPSSILLSYLLLKRPSGSSPEMRYSLTLLVSAAMAARPFLNEPDTGIGEILADHPTGTLPDIENAVALNDFEYIARNYLPVANYTYYRNGAGGEWSYRNNLEVYNRYRFKPRTMVDVTNLPASLT